MGNGNDSVDLAVRTKLQEIEDEILRLKAEVKKLEGKKIVYLELLGEPIPEQAEDESEHTQDFIPRKTEKKIVEGSLYGLSVPQACLRYLEVMGLPPKSTDDVLKGVQFGGQTKLTYALVYNSLTRLVDQGKVVRPTDKTWAPKSAFPHLGNTPPKPIKEKKEKKEKVSGKGKPIKVKKKKTEGDAKNEEKAEE